MFTLELSVGLVFAAGAVAGVIASVIAFVVIAVIYSKKK